MAVEVEVVEACNRAVQRRKDNGSVVKSLLADTRIEALLQEGGKEGSEGGRGGPVWPW